MDKVRDLDDVNNLEFFSEFFSMFGAMRAFELMGFALWIGIRAEAGLIEDIPSLRVRLADEGLKKAATYRALADLKRFRDHIESKESSSITLTEIVLRLSSHPPSEIPQHATP